MVKLILYCLSIILMISLAYAGDYTLVQDRCDTGTGISSDPFAKDCKFPGTDCCLGKQDYHIHDLNITAYKDDVSGLSADFMPGKHKGCESHGIIYLSLSINGPWTYLGNTEDIIAYNTTVKQFSSVPVDFRYVKIQDSGNCYVANSGVKVFLSPDEVPEFSTAAGVIAALGAIGAIVVIKRKH